MRLSLLSSLVEALSPMRRLTSPPGTSHSETNASHKDRSTFLLFFLFEMVGDALPFFPRAEAEAITDTGCRLGATARAPCPRWATSPLFDAPFYDVVPRVFFPSLTLCPVSKSTGVNLRMTELEYLCDCGQMWQAGSLEGI